MAKKIKLRLILDVDYNPNGVSRDYLENLLDGIAQSAASDGLMTGETEAEVVSWNATVEERK